MRVMDKEEFFIEVISNKVRKEMNLFEKICLFITKNYLFHHWGIGLYIRNNYIYNNKELMNVDIDPDELSQKILKRVVRR